MNQAKVQQKIQGPINRRRSRAGLLLQFFQNLVGTDRFMLLPDQFEDFAPDGGKALSLLKADLFGLEQGVGDALLVVMIRIDEA